MRLLNRAISGVMAGVILAAGLMLVSVPSAAIEVDWCSSDPIFTVDNTTFHMTAYWPRENMSSVTSVTYVVTVSDDARVSYRIPKGETTNVNIVWKRVDNDRNDQITASATVNATGSFITKNEIETKKGSQTVYGRSNQPMSATITLKSGENR